MKHVHELKESYGKADVWYCITCEKRVRMFDDASDSQYPQSYFIGVYPNNSRMCVGCMADTIKEGTC